MWSSQDTRLKLFNDYMDCGKDFAQVEALFQSRLEETQRSSIKYGFRNDQWLIKHHGEKKATKIMQRKKKTGTETWPFVWVWSGAMGKTWYSPTSFMISSSPHFSSHWISGL